jgi:hypothetical protein
MNTPEETLLITPCMFGSLLLYMGEKSSQKQRVEGGGGYVRWQTLSREGT